MSNRAAASLSASRGLCWHRALHLLWGRLVLSANMRTSPLHLGASVMLFTVWGITSALTSGQKTQMGTPSPPVCSGCIGCTWGQSWGGQKENLGLPHAHPVPHGWPWFLQPSCIWQRGALPSLIPPAQAYRFWGEFPSTSFQPLLGCRRLLLALMPTLGQGGHRVRGQERSRRAANCSLLALERSRTP